MKYDNEWYRSYYGKYLRDYVTIMLVVLNIAAFIGQIVIGDSITDGGALVADSVLADGEYYRLVTSLFLHADIAHIVSNMVGLFFLGGYVETCVGHISFGILYFGSGILGNAASLYWENMMGETWYSIGASGAVFGITGAVLTLIIWNSIRIRRSGGHGDRSLLFRVGFVMVYMIYAGFAATNVNNAAHIGGMLAGIVITLLIITIKRGRIVVQEI